MNVENPYLKTATPPRYDQAAAKSEGASSAGRPPARLHAVNDQVVISYKARIALHEMRTMPDVDLTIKALMSAAPLTEERAGEVLRRIQQGYYKQPEVLQKIATLLSQALEGEP